MDTADPIEGLQGNERRHVTVLAVALIDLEGRAHGVDPELLQLWSREFEELVRTEVEERGGMLERISLGAAVCLFGAVISHEDDPERAVRAALAIVEGFTGDAANAVGPRFEVGAGVSTAETIVAGSSREGLGLVWGGLIDQAIGLQDVAGRGRVLVDEATRRATSRAVAYEDVAGHARVRSLREVPEPRAEWTELVGRYAELGLLRDSWSGVETTHRPRFVAVLGEAGVGKTRLVDEFVRGLGDAVVHRGRCLPYGEGITFWPLREIVRDAASIRPAAQPADARPALRALVERLGDSSDAELGDVKAALEELAGCAEVGAGEVPNRAQQEWAVIWLLTALAGERPRLLVLEDLHWAEAPLLELLDRVPEGASGPLMIVGTARPELAERWASLNGRQTGVVSLPPLSSSECDALLRSLMRNYDIDATNSIESLVDRAAGNPLFAEELVAMLDDAGPDGIASPAELLPESIERLIGSRLDLLGRTDRQLLGYATVLGMTFSATDLGVLAAGEVGTRLEELAQRDLIRPAGSFGASVWNFKHALVRDVAYARVPKAERVKLHAAVADLMVERDEVGLVELIAYHLEQSCLVARDLRSVTPPVDRAVAALRVAGDKAEWRDGPRDAARFYERALALAADDHADALVVKLRLGGVWNAFGDLQESEAILLRVASDAAAGARPDVEAAAELGLASVVRKQGRGTDARDHVRRAEALAEEAANLPLRIRAMYESANLHAWFDADEGAVEEMRRGLALAQTLDDAALAIRGLQWLGMLLFNVGRLSESADVLTRALGLARASDRRREDAQITAQLAWSKYYLGGLGEAERLALEATERLRRTGDSIVLSQSLLLLSFCARLGSDATAAEAFVREALQVSFGVTGSMRLEFHRCLIDLLVVQGRVREAREVAGQALDGIREQEPYAQTASMLIKARLAAAEGRRSEAEGRYRDAIRLLEEQRLPIDLGEARLAFARVLRHFGDDEAAKTVLLEGRSELERMGAELLLSQTDRELATITVARLT
jgi:tetratricopeptide (TPR) repeat protein